MRAYQRYIAINSVGAYLYYFFIFAPLYASQNGITLEAAGWIFSGVYALQAVLTYTLGRLFERFSPNWGVIIGRAIFGLGPLVLFFRIDTVSFITAMILASFFDVFFPSFVLFERAIFPPQKREFIYRTIIFVSESVKMCFLVPIVAFHFRPSRSLFLTQFLAAISFSLAFYLFLPKISTGSEVHGGSFTSNKRNLLFIYLGQLFILMAFNLAGWMMKCYYLNDVLHGTSQQMLVSEMYFSFTILAFYPLAFRLRRSLRFNMIVGSLFMTLFFIIMAFPSLATFYISHILIGAGFFLWQPAKDSLKFQNAPPKLGRWEGFFQGVNIFSRIVFPPLAAFLARTISYSSVFMAAGILGAIGTAFFAGVKHAKG